MTPEERATFLVTDLDRIARDYNYYEYGLPINNNGEFTKMLAIAAAAIRAAVEEERKKWADILEKERATL